MSGYLLPYCKSNINGFIGKIFFFFIAFIFLNNNEVYCQDSIEISIIDQSSTPYNALKLVNQNSTDKVRYILLNKRVVCKLSSEDKLIKGKIIDINENGIVIKTDSIPYDSISKIAYEPKAYLIGKLLFGSSGTVGGLILTIPGVYLGYLVLEDLIPDSELSGLGSMFAVLIAPMLLATGIPVLAGGITYLALPHFFYNINDPWKIEAVYKPKDSKKK